MIIVEQWLHLPGQLHPKRVEQVEDAPGDDDVVVEAQQKGDDGAGDAHAAQEGVDFVPDADRARAQLLPDAQLQIEERDAQEDQADCVGNQEGA